MIPEMALTPLSRPALRHVVNNLRPKDREELFATEFTDDPQAIVDACMVCPDFAWIASLDEPIAAVGAHPLNPATWQVYAFATPRFREIAYPLTKFVKRAMIPSLASSGVRRAQCLSLASHAEAHKWLKYLGAEQESTLREFGRNGEDFVMFTWHQKTPDVHSRTSLA